jgi:hypothetical protein
MSRKAKEQCGRFRLSTTPSVCHQSQPSARGLVPVVGLVIFQVSDFFNMPEKLPTLKIVSG